LGEVIRGIAIQNTEDLARPKHWEGDDSEWGSLSRESLIERIEDLGLVTLDPEMEPLSLKIERDRAELKTLLIINACESEPYLTANHSLMMSHPTEMIKGVVLLSAFPNIISAILLAISRAVGETMIVVMAAGLVAKLTLNPLESVTTATVQIVTLLG